MYSNLFETFVELGKRLKSDSLRVPYKKTLLENAWFDPESIDLALAGIAKFLEEDKLQNWVSRYSKPPRSLTVGLITAGNIPLVGFHDILCILLSGHKVQLKPSSKDKALTHWVVEKLAKLNPSIAKKIKITTNLGRCSAYIATGSDNTNRYFEYNFKGQPHLIRKNRTSIAILKGDENDDELKGLFKDIALYYGLGCRNVSSILVPKNYPIKELSKFAKPYKKLLDNPGYKSNYTYNKAIYKLNKVDIVDMGGFLFRKDPAVYSPIAVVHFSYYQNSTQLKKFLDSNIASLQCIVNGNKAGLEGPSFGMAQFPEVDDYQDGIDTMKFLSEL